MKRFELQGVELPVPASKAFTYIADPVNLTAWTNAFAQVEGNRALMRTPQGEVDVVLKVMAVSESGTVDWHMTFPDGAQASAFSRVTPLDQERCVYSFILTPPPAPLEKIEGALAEQGKILAQELTHLRSILSSA
jgi:hypothetical protein